MINPLLKLIITFITPFQLNWSQAVTAAVNAVSSERASSKVATTADHARAQQERSLDETKRQYDIGQENIAPYLQAGRRGLDQYESMLNQDGLAKWGGFNESDMQQDPGYQFRLQQGYQGLDRMAAKGGNRFSGGRAMGLMQYGQQMASQEFGAARNRAFQDYQTRRGEGVFRLGEYASLAASGQQAAGAASNLGAGYANALTGINQGIAGSMMEGGRAQAAGYLGMGNAVTSGLAAYNYGQGAQGGYGGNTPSYAPQSVADSGDAYLPAYGGYS